jgi:hypothetical protein
MVGLHMIINGFEPWSFVITNKGYTIGPSPMGAIDKVLITLIYCMYVK